MDEPTSLRAGDSAGWTVSLPDYPASAGWVLKYRLLSLAGVAKDIPTTPVGDDHQVSLSAANTADYPAGVATLVRMVEKEEARITLGAPLITILPNLGEATNHDGRTRNEKALADAEAALEAYLAAGQATVQEYEVAGRKMTFRAVAEIEALIKIYTLRVAKDRFTQSLLSGGSVPGRIHYRG